MMGSYSSKKRLSERRESGVAGFEIADGKLSTHKTEEFPI